ncbi:PREDICTED: condensin-2 complex subunit H2-like [Priapulus caudatus]|uniref:Condensin-2 complex subunit H2-like n=1 Tax=Priapulus caudatus TaxID=37621 RepID=A0ABM1EHI2_PRICU|nr:PREDICTED: condensin-2 complex subunit H2-like [Priapulus caudatus]
MSRLIMLFLCLVHTYQMSYLIVLFLCLVRTCQQKLPKNPLHRPLCAEFTELFLTEQLKRKTRSKLRAQNNKDAPLDDLHQLVEDDQRELDEEPLAGCHDDEDDDDNNDMPAFASEDADNRLGSDEPFISEHTLQQQQQQQGAIECISSYEELVLKYTEGFLASAKEYTHMTELAKRVSQWEEKILPVLEQEETRGSFDIHKHGSLILDSFSHTPSAKVKKVPFKQIVSGKSTYDVCRYFLSALQLANSHNIEISQDAQGADGMDTMAIRLLSRKRIHEDLQEYRAPSLQQ